MICQYVNRETLISLTIWIGQGQWQFQGEFWAWGLSFHHCQPPWHLAIVPKASENITAGCPPIANTFSQRWYKCKKNIWYKPVSREMIPDEGHHLNRVIFSSSSGKHHNAFYKIYQNGKTGQSRWWRVFILYFLPYLKWAIAFLPRRLKRPMKTKVLQSR